MRYRLFCAAASALAMVVGANAVAAKNPEQNRHDGKVVRITSSKLVMTDMGDKGGKEHSHTLAADAKVTLDGKACKAEDLKAGTKIRVTTKMGDASVATRIEAIDKNETFAATHDGKVVSITGNKLVMSNLAGKEGKQHSHTLAADAKVTLDGKACRATDLKPGTRIRVTTQGADKSVATRIEAIDKNSGFASDSQDGKVVSITGNKLVMMDAQGTEENTCTLAADVKVTCDGKVCKSSDLKPGMRIRVTTDSDDPNTVRQVEAIDKNRDFASR